MNASGRFYHHPHFFLQHILIFDATVVRKRHFFAKALVITGCSYSLYVAITRYVHHQSHLGSWMGLWRYIWEGDSLPSHIRDSIHRLQKITQDKIPEITNKLESIEIQIQVAILNSVDPKDDITSSRDTSFHSSTITKIDHSSNDNPTPPPQHYIFVQNPKLRKQILSLSTQLDSIVSLIDDIPSYQNHQVRREKKLLSQTMVQFMETVDSLFHYCTNTCSHTGYNSIPTPK